MSNDVTEPWPFPAARVRRLVATPRKDAPALTSPPPLVVTSRNAAPEPAPASPPPLTIRRPSQDANAAPQASEQGQGGTTPPPLVQTSSKTVLSGPENPPTLVEVTKPVEPPPLQIVERKRVEPPKLEVKHISPVVYLLIGRNHLTEEISLCQVIPEAEFKKVEKRGEEELAAYLINLVSADSTRLKASTDGKVVWEHDEHMYFDYPVMTPRQKQSGIVSKAELWDRYYTDEDKARQRDMEEEEDRAPLQAYDSEIPHEHIYSWAVVCCDLKQIPRLNLSAILASE